MRAGRWRVPKRWRLCASALSILVAACAHEPVEPSLRGPQADRDIVNLVELRLSSDQRLCPFDIDVISVNRTVRLEGKVGSVVGRARAEAIAKGAGADAVINRLTLDPTSADRHRC